MAYNKKTWLARLGQGLNKFSIDGATPVPIINQPDSVTQQGDALSAGNLNDLEQRIADAFDDVEESKADKSTTEELQSQINQQEARIENLEQKAGDYSIVQYRGTNAVPTGKAHYGLVKNIVGKTRAWNQLCNLTDGSTTVGGVPITKSNGKITLNGSCSGSNNYDLCSVNVVAGHKYLIVAVGASMPVSNNSTTMLQLYDNTSSDVRIYENSNYNWAIGIISNTATGTFRVRVENGTTYNYSCYPQLYDLTLMGLESATSLEDVIAVIPDIGKYNPYSSGSLVSTTVEGVESVGFNIWDEEWENGYYNTSTGEPVVNPNRIRSKNYIKISPNTSYCSRASTGHYCRVLYYDGNKTYIGPDNNSGSAVYVGTTPSNCQYIRFYQANDATSYNNDICINISQPNTAISPHNGDYVPYKTDTLSLSETVTLRGVGTCVETLDLETGVLDDGKFATVDLSTLSWTTSGTVQNAYYATLDVGYKFSFDVQAIGSIYSFIGTASGTSILNNYDRCFALYYNSGGSDREIYLKDSSISSASQITGTILVEKATYTPSSPVSPVPDNTIYTEGGGTIDTVQTQTPVIDNCLDVGYLAV